MSRAPGPQLLDESGGLFFGPTGDQSAGALLLLLLYKPIPRRIVLLRKAANLARVHRMLLHANGPPQQTGELVSECQPIGMRWLNPQEGPDAAEHCGVGTNFR
jgi:hypothetical protein